MGSTVSALQAVERDRGTIKESVWELCDKEVEHRVGMSQGSCPRIGGCAATRVGWEVTLDVTVHDKMSMSRQIEESGLAHHF